MESQSSPYIEDGLLPAGSIDLGINSVAAEKTLCNSISSSGCERRLYKERPSYPPWIYLLGIAFTSLAAIYFLLRCYDFVRERPKVIGLARSLAAGGYRACLGNTNQDEEEEQAGKAGEFKGTFGQDNEATELDGDDPQVGPTEGQLREGEAGDVWGRRNLPPFAEKQFVALFERMVDAASLCRSLLPTLNESEGLRLTHEVIRVMALDLGALSLVRKHLEPFRLVLGNALVDLGSDALKRSRGVGELETCKAIRELMLVVGELKEPRPFTENPFNLKYKMKMTSILRTAEATGNYCMTVLKELLSATQQPRRLAPTDFERLLRVLKALYRVHSSHIAKDGALRFYIVMIQDKMGSKVGADRFRTVVTCSKSTLPCSLQSHRQGWRTEVLHRDDPGQDGREASSRGSPPPDGCHADTPSAAHGR
ncbi:hypothetical protein, conserved [Eimeria praecox]|uniref:Transmembrane protein n=1 Tax=Eimeria praecox TaxID=51316 RepID=U6H520_9EIME|nr:hypothetical protein, conserved [Eimeria praecox]